MEQKNNWRRDFRLATFAVFNHLNQQITEPSININDANDSFSILKHTVKGAYVARASKVEEYTLPLHVSTQANAFDIKHLWDIHVPVLQMMHVKLGLRPDNLPTLLPPIGGTMKVKDKVTGKMVTKKIEAVLRDKASTRHRGKYGGLIDRDNTYKEGEFDETGLVRYAESAMWNKGTSTLPKQKRKDRDGAGITTTQMPDTANVELSQMRLDQLIKPLLKEGLSFGQVKKHCKRKLKLRNSGSQIERTLKRLNK